MVRKKVKKMIDGDTGIFSDGQKFRLARGRAPEKNQPSGSKATKIAAGMTGRSKSRLNPIELINILMENLTKEMILSGDEKGKRQIFKIIDDAFMNHNYEIAKIGLDATSKRAKIIFKNNKFERLVVVYVSNYFFKNLVIVGKNAINRYDDEAALDVIDTMQEISDTLTERGLDAMTADYFEDIGRLATGNDMENVVVEIIVSLEKIGVSAINNELFLSADHVVESFEKLRENILRGNFTDAPRKLMRSLGEFGEHSTKNKQIQDEITWKVISCLNELKISAFELGIVKSLISSFRQIAAAIVIHESEDIYQITSNLLSIQETAYERFNEVADEVTENIIIDLKFIGVLSIRKHHLKNASINIINSLKDAGIKAIEHNTAASYLSPSYLGQLGEITIEEKQYELTELIIERLNEIRGKAQEYGSWQTEEKADTGINELTQALNKR